MSATDTTPRTGPASMTTRPGRHRFRAVWAATLAGLLGLLFTALTAVTVALWASDSSYTETNPVVDLAFLALGLIIAVGFASQIRGRHVAGLQQAILALLTLAAVGWLGGRIEPLVGPLVLVAVAAPLMVLHPDRGRLASTGAGLSRPLAVLATGAAVPAIVYAASMLGYARAAGPSGWTPESPCATCRTSPATPTPKTVRRYDRSRHAPNRHATYAIARFLAGASRRRPDREPR